MTALDTLPSTPDFPPSDTEVWILIVDDEPGNRDTLQDLYAEKGYRVETAATGQQALEKARSRFFHAAILDVRLPDVNGTEVLTQLKELHPDTACIMVTGYASLQSCISALHGGASNYLLKPLDFVHLFTVVDQAVARQRSLSDDGELLRRYRERIRDLESRETQLAERVQRLEQEIAALQRPEA